MSDEVVVGASVAIKWILEEPYCAEAPNLLNRWAAAGSKLAATTLFLYEIANVLTKRMQRQQLTLAQAKDRLRFFLQDGPLLQQGVEVHTRALELADHFRLPTSYDAHYLALAELRSADFWTADERPFNSVKRELKWVHWLGERER